MKKLIKNSKCGCNEKYEFSGCPFMDRVIHYYGGLPKYEINPLCGPDVTVVAFRCPKCGHEIWRGDCGEVSNFRGITYQDDASKYDDGLMLMEIMSTLKSR